MRSIHKATPPAGVRSHASAWQREIEIDPAILANTRAVRARFDDLDKVVPREALCREQGRLCAFCLGRIRPPSPIADTAGTTLAHVVPLRVDPRRIFDWTNIVGACPGGSGTARHCDNLQGDRTLFINPAAVASIERIIRYSSRGRLLYAGPELAGRTPAQIQAEFDDVLGLNIERLRDNRRTVLEAAQQAMDRLGWSRSNLNREIRRWSTPDTDGYAPYFCVAVSYLQQKLQAQP